jgi:uncharacterized membrane protein
MFPRMTQPSFPATFSEIWPWLRRHPVFPVLPMFAASSILCLALVAARRWITGSGRLEFLPFNLLLAFLPVLFLLISENPRRRWQVFAGGFLWLLFFPNAPYILTDMVHYNEGLGHAAWVDMLALLAAGWAALIAGMTTLRLMQVRVAAAVSPSAGHGFVLIVLLLSSVGIYMGRFLRFHSWHALLKPDEVLTRTANDFSHPHGNPVSWPFTLGMFALLVCMHYSLVAFTRACRNETLPQPAAQP